MTHDLIANAVIAPGAVSLDEIAHLNLTDRMESKFLIPFRLVPSLLNKIGSNYRILEIEGHRVFNYHNIYFDTPDFLFYHQHVRGELPRSKVRMRKYENSGATYLEIKSRTNRNRVKKYRVPIEEFRDEFSENQMSFIEEHLRVGSGELKPVLINRYKRITLACCQHEERVTIDYDISWSSLKGDTTAYPYMSVVEIKKSVSCKSSFMGKLMKERLIHPSGFSKYCTGNAVINDSVRQNKLKKKFLLMKKIEYDNTGYID
jgi:hypothetical protein